MTGDIRALAAIATVFMMGTAAQATTLTFDDSVTVNGGDPGNYGDRVVSATEDAQGSGAAAAGTYLVGVEGPTPNVSVEYLGSDASIWTPVGQYSGLTNVLYNEIDGAPLVGIRFSADTGFNVTLQSFQIGNFGGAITLPDVSLLGFTVGSTSGLALGPQALPASTGSPLTFTGLNFTANRIDLLVGLTGLGGNSDNVGLDNIVFSQSVAEQGPSPIPVPASLPLLLAGLGALGVLRRRR